MAQLCNFNSLDVPGDAKWLAGKHNSQVPRAAYLLATEHHWHSHSDTRGVSSCILTYPLPLAQASPLRDLVELLKRGDS